MRIPHHSLVCSRLCFVGLAAYAFFTGPTRAEDVYRVDYLGKWTAPAGTTSLRYVADLEGGDVFYYPSTNGIYTLKFASLGGTPTLALGISSVSSASPSTYVNGDVFILNDSTYTSAFYDFPSGAVRSQTDLQSSPGITSLYSINADYTQTVGTLNVATGSLLYTRPFSSGPGATSTGIFFRNYTGTTFGPEVQIYAASGAKGGQQVWLSDDGTTIYLWDPCDRRRR